MEHFLIELEMDEEEVNLLELVSVSPIELQLVLLADDPTGFLDRVENVVQVVVDNATARNKVAPDWVLGENERNRLNVLVCPPILVVIACCVYLALERRKGGILVLLRRRWKRDIGRNLNLANHLRLRLNELCVLQQPRLRFRDPQEVLPAVLHGRRNLGDAVLGQLKYLTLRVRLELLEGAKLDRAYRDHPEPVAEDPVQKLDDHRTNCLRLEDGLRERQKLRMRACTGLGP